LATTGANRGRIEVAVVTQAAWSRTGRAGDQAEQPAQLPAAERVVPRRAGQCELARGAGSRPAVDAHAPEHLALDEQQVARVEEAVEFEERVGHARVVGVERTVAGEELDLGEGDHARPPRASGRRVGEMTPRGQRSPRGPQRKARRHSVDTSREIG
jgi:hypothetical protein